MKFKKGDKLYCINDDSYWTCDGYSESGNVLLAEQKYIQKSTGKRPDYYEYIFRKLTKLELALK